MIGLVLTIAFCVSFIALGYGIGATQEASELRVEIVDLAARVLILESRPK